MGNVRQIFNTHIRESTRFQRIHTIRIHHIQRNKSTAVLRHQRKQRTTLEWEATRTKNRPPPQLRRHSTPIHPTSALPNDNKRRQQPILQQPIATNESNK